MPTTKSREAVAVSDLNLQGLFYKNSKARAVAERLLSGKPLSRSEAVEGLDVSLTTVPRVVDVLERAGYVVERHTDQSRQAIFQVKGLADQAPIMETGDPEVGAVVGRYRHSQGEQIRVKVTDLATKGGEVWIECKVGKTSYRGRIIQKDGAVQIPAALLAGEAEILEIVLLSTGKYGVVLGDQQASVLVAEYQET